MRLDEVLHQPRALAALRSAIEHDRIPHAFLFEGPEGVGKMFAARALAARLLCLSSIGDENQNALFGDIPAVAVNACGACESCRLLKSGNHPDFQHIHRKLNKLHPDNSVRRSTALFLVVELIRHFLIEPAALRPMVSNRRVFVVEEAERMNEAAQNALLKTLEEPSAGTVIILVTTSADRLLATIRSRCHRVPFGLLPPDFVAERLQQETGLDVDGARALATLSGGRLGAALRWRLTGLLDALDDVAALLRRRDPADPEFFAKAMIDAASQLAKRTLAAAAELDDSDDDDDADAGRRSKQSSRTPKTIPTDALRDALKLVLMLTSATFRDALVARLESKATSDPSAAARLLLLPTQSDLVTAIADQTDDEACFAAIDAVAETERMLDRNVAPQLAGEHLAAHLPRSTMC